MYESAFEQDNLLQNTGRRDKYKNYIYEKDILFENDSLDGKKLEVYWDNMLSSFRCQRGVYTCPIPESKKIGVIGNANEHPELLITK